MASFFILSSSTTARTLAAGETGFVAEGATLYSNASNPVTISGNAAVTAMGSIVGDAGFNAVGMGSLTDFLNITVGQQGSIVASQAQAITGFTNNSLTLNNAGLIAGNSEAIRVTANSVVGVVADYHVANSGTIQSDGDSTTENTIEFTTPTGGLVNFANTGTIVNGGAAGAISIIGARLDLTNSGTIQCRSVNAAIITDLGNDTVDNAGTIIGGLLLNEGNDVVTNTGTITGNISTANGSDSLTNMGTIIGLVNLADTVTSGLITDVVVNAGLITGDVLLGNGNDTFRSEGGHVGGTVFGGSGDDQYFVDDSALAISDAQGNNQVTASVDYVLAAGLNTLFLNSATGLHGTGNADANQIVGSIGDDTIRGGLGNDSLEGSDGDDRIFGGRGNDELAAFGDDDLVRGGGDDDLLRYVDGNATLDGGHGTDALSFVFVSEAVVLNLATGTGSAGSRGAFTVSGVERVEGGTGADSITGGIGNETIAGGTGNDTILGGGGNDVIAGVGGADNLSGGGGDDVFDFNFISDSTAGNADLITDFARLRDKIDLSDIEAVFAAPGASFVFIGTGAFTNGASGEVRFSTDSVAGTTTIEARQANNPGTPDLVIVLTGVLTLAETNFIL